MSFSDKTLKCVVCAEEFVFSADEQRFFHDKQFQHEPKRCKKCKARRDHMRRRLETNVICAECGSPTIVPFLPSQGRPVLCRACFDRVVQVALAAHSIPIGSSPQVEGIGPGGLIEGNCALGSGDSEPLQHGCS